MLGVAEEYVFLWKRLQCGRFAKRYSAVLCGDHNDRSKYYCSVRLALELANPKTFGRKRPRGDRIFQNGTPTAGAAANLADHRRSAASPVASQDS